MCQGELIKALARRILKLPVLRFVDDYFSAESKETAQHAMKCFARCVCIFHACLFLVPVACFTRLVRAIMGEDAIAKNKLEHGNPLTILGITIEINMAGVIFAPNEEKVSTHLVLAYINHSHASMLSAGESMER